jgi:hypothetical protein
MSNLVREICHASAEAARRRIGRLLSASIETTCWAGLHTGLTIACFFEGGPVSSASTNKRARSLYNLAGHKEVEQRVGDRYRHEVSDKGLGLTRHGMQVRLKSWGYEASREACQEWLKRHRLGLGDAVDGNAAM